MLFHGQSERMVVVVVVLNRGNMEKHTDTKKDSHTCGTGQSDIEKHTDTKKDSHTCGVG